MASTVETVGKATTKMMETKEILNEIYKLADEKPDDWTILYSTRGNLLALRYRTKNYHINIKPCGDVYMSSPKTENSGDSHWEHKIELGYFQQRRLRKVFEQLINEKIKRDIDRTGD